MLIPHCLAIGAYVETDLSGGLISPSLWRRVGKVLRGGGVWEEGRVNGWRGLRWGEAEVNRQAEETVWTGPVVILVGMGPTGTGVDLCASAQERLQGVSHSSPEIISSSSAFLSRSTAVSVDQEGAREVFCFSKTRGRRKKTVFSDKVKQYFRLYDRLGLLFLFYYYFKKKHFIALTPSFLTACT